MAAGVRDVVVNLIGHDMLSAKLAEAGAVAERTGSKVAALGKTIVGAAGIVAGATAAIGVSSIKAAMSFQDQMTLMVTQARVPQDQIGALHDGILNLASKVGFAPDSLAQALYHIESTFAKFGMTAPQALEALKVAAQGSQVGMSDLESTTNAMGAVMLAGLPGINSYADAMNWANAVVGTGDMRMSDLVSTLEGGAIPVLKTFGWSALDVGAAVALMGDNLNKGSKAATALRMMAQALSKPVATAGAALKRLGLDGKDLSKMMAENGLEATFSMLHDKMVKAGVKAKEVGGVFTDIFGKKAGMAPTVLEDQFAKFMETYDALDKAMKNPTAAWEITKQTSRVKVEKFTAAIDTLKTRVGEALLPMFDKVVERVTKFADGLGTSKKKAQELADYLVATFAVAAGVLVTAFVIATWEILLAIAAIVAVGVAVKKAWEKFEFLHKIAKDLAKFWEEKLLPVMQRATDIAGGVLKKAWDDLSSTYRDNRAQIDKLLERVGKLILIFTGSTFVAALATATALLFALLEAVSLVAQAYSWLADKADAANRAIDAAGGIYNYITGADGTGGSQKLVKGGDTAPRAMSSSKVRAYADGGWVSGSGPQPATVHGGEFVLSNSMLAGQKAIPGSVAGLLGTGGGSALVVNVSVNGMLSNARDLTSAVVQGVSTAKAQGFRIPKGAFS